MKWKFLLYLRICLFLLLILAGEACTVRPRLKVFGLLSLVSQASVQFSVGGAVTGLTGSLVLQNNLSENLTIQANGNFTFTNLYSNNLNYSVTILTQPNSQTCIITNASGVILNSNVTNISITCSSGISTLSSLSVSSGNLTPDFSKTETSYRFSVMNSVTSLTITPTATDTSSSITVNGSSVISGLSSSSISLSVGLNTVTIVVTNANSTTTYTLYIIRSTLNAYRIFVTASTYDGNLMGTSTDGPSGADSKCNSDSNKPTDGSTYKAVLTDVNNRNACVTNANCTSSTENINWAMRANSAYARIDGTALFSTNTAGIYIFGSMSNSFGGGQFWTGISTTTN